jgi:hypothetical protein
VKTAYNQQFGKQGADENGRMIAALSIFLDFNLPNSTTWFYFSWLLAMALFFKFGRLLSVRNWDVVTLFLLVPGLLFLQEARPNLTKPETNPAFAVAALVADNGSGTLAGPVVGLEALGANMRLRDDRLAPTPWLTIGYLWLLCGSGYFLVRCLFDLVLVTRPALAPNLSFGGLAWLGGALFICLAAVAFRQPDRPISPQAVAPSPLTTTAKAERKSAAIDLAEADLPSWGKRALALCFHLAVAIGLVVVAARHFQDAHAGMAAATFYLILPYSGFFMGEVTHVWPMAFMVWAVLAYRLPMLAGCLLGLAAGTTYFPALVLPVWLSFYRGRGAGRFLVTFSLTSAVCLAIVGVKFWFDNDLSQKWGEIWSLSAWQAWRVPKEESFWTGIHWAYRIPVFIAYVAFVLTTAFWPTPKNLAHVIALSAAVLIGIQFWYADQGGIYILWYLPFLLLLVFRPNLSDRRPLLIQRETDWLCRLGRVLARFFCWLLRLPQPMMPAS